MPSLLAGFSLPESQRLKPAGQRFGGVKGLVTTWPPRFPIGTWDVGPIVKDYSRSHSGWRGAVNNTVCLSHTVDRAKPASNGTAEAGLGGQEESKATHCQWLLPCTKPLRSFDQQVSGEALFPAGASEDGLGDTEGPWNYHHWVLTSWKMGAQHSFLCNPLFKKKKNSL